MDIFAGSNILVTGGLGFIGSHLVRRLVATGAKVTIADNEFQGGGANFFNISDFKDKVQVQITDVRNTDRLAELVRNKEFIFHLAAQTSHEDSMKSPYTDITINTLGMINILESSRKSRTDPHIIFTGTRGQFGRIYKTPVSEDYPKHPIDVNGVSKQAAESLLKVYSQYYGLKFTSLRLTNTYGPGQPLNNPKQGFVPFFVSRALEDKSIQIFGEGSILRDLSYVSDVVDALIICANSKQALNESFNIGSGQPASILDIANSIIKIAGKGKLEFVECPEYWKDIEVGNYIADISKIKEYLGWRPKVSLEEGLTSMIQYYKNTREKYIPK